MDYFRGIDEADDEMRKRFWKVIFLLFGSVLIAILGFYGYLGYIIQQVVLEILGR